MNKSVVLYRIVTYRIGILIIWDGVIMVVGEFDVLVSFGGEFFNINVSLLNARPTVVCRQYWGQGGDRIYGNTGKRG